MGNRIRVRGEIRGGFAGLTMMHPVVKPAGGELATALTPVYPTVAGLPQTLSAPGGAGRSGACRVVGYRAVAVPARDWPASLVESASSAFLFAQPDARCVAGDAAGPQSPGLAAAQGRGTAGAATLAIAGAPCPCPAARAEADQGRLRKLVRAPAGGAAISAHDRAAARRGRNRAGHCPTGAHAPPVAGRCRRRQNRGGRAGRSAVHRCRLAVRADGAHRDSGRPSTLPSWWAGCSPWVSRWPGSRAARRPRNGATCWR